jgi:hypothetical protein
MPGDAIISRLKQKLPKTRTSAPESPVQDPSPVDAVAVRDQRGAAETRDREAAAQDAWEADSPRTIWITPSQRKGWVWWTVRIHSARPSLNSPSL